MFSVINDRALHEKAPPGRSAELRSSLRSLVVTALAGGKVPSRRTGGLSSWLCGPTVRVAALAAPFAPATREKRPLLSRLDDRRAITHLADAS